MAFKVGDKVRLKSGGPDMVVESATRKKISCVWWPLDPGGNFLHSPNSYVFVDAALELF